MKTSVKTLVLATVMVLGLGAVAHATQNNDEHKQGHHPKKDLFCRFNEDNFVIVPLYQKQVKDADFAYLGGKDPITGGWCTDNQPGDKCANIAGLQSDVPDNMLVDEQRVCANKPVVVPPVPQPEPPVVEQPPFTMK